MSESIDLDAYFRRIGYSGPAEPTRAVLEALHERHPKAIPFENLDPLAGVTPRLDLPSLQAKLVAGGRGGYCFEHNRLFKAVLEEIGFSVQSLAARVQWMAPPERVAPRTHRLLQVRLPEGDVLADVGFGGVVLTKPLGLILDEPQDTGHGVLRIVERGGERQLQFLTREGFAPKYQFSLQPQEEADYELANWFTATHPQSQFVTTLICARVLDDRRIGLRGSELTVRLKSGEVERRRLDAAAIEQALVSDFGLPAEPVARVRGALERAAAG